MIKNNRKFISSVCSSNQGRIQEFLTGGSKLWFRKDCWFFLWQITSPPHPLPPIVVARFNSLASYRVLEFYSYRIHPWNILLLCLVTKIVQISSTSMSMSWCKCMSASPDNHSSDMTWFVTSQRIGTLSFGRTNRKGEPIISKDTELFSDAGSVIIGCVGLFSSGLFRYLILRTLAKKETNFNAAFTFDNTTWNWTFF